MNIEKYIRHLLTENRFLIVPGLGAFSLKYKPAQIDEENDEILPPSAEVSFNQEVNHNDGVLAEWIAQNEQISTDEALQKILEFTELLFSKLDYGETVRLSKIGNLFLADNREIKFESSSGELFIPEVYGLEKISLKDNISEEEDIPAVPVIAEETVSSEPEADIQEEEPKLVLPVQPAASAPEIKRKRRNRWPGILLLLLIIILAALLFFVLNKKKQSEKPVQVKTEIPQKPESPVMVADSVETDVTNVPEPEAVAEDESVSVLPGQIEPDETKFYLIGGSFQDEKNAEKYIRQMKNKGFEPFHLGKQGSFYLVGLETFDNKIEAFGAQYNFLDKYPDSGVWVYFSE